MGRGEIKRNMIDYGLAYVRICKSYKFLILRRTILGYFLILTQFLSPEYPFLWDQRKERQMHIVHINAISTLY